MQNNTLRHFCRGFIKEKRKSAGEKEELSILKKFCRSNNLPYDKGFPSARLLQDLWAKTADNPSREAKRIIQDMKCRRLEILNEAMREPVSMIRWLYEHQGVRRFDASNRLFLLVDCDNFFASWKLKRAKPFLVDRIHGHLNRVRQAGYDPTFRWEGTPYTVTSDVIFVTHQRG